EKATSRLEPIEDGEGATSPEAFPTPGVRTIEDLINFPGGANSDRQIKTLVYVLDDKLALVLLRGEHDMNETKIMEASRTRDVRPARPEEIREALGASAGSLGAVGVSKSTHPRIALVLADETLKGRRNMTTGANKDDLHVRGVSVDRDIAVDKWASLRSVKA